MFVHLTNQKFFPRSDLEHVVLMKIHFKVQLNVHFVTVRFNTMVLTSHFAIYVNKSLNFKTIP